MCCLPGLCHPFPHRLFPLREPGVNWHAKPLTPGDRGELWEVKVQVTASHRCSRVPWGTEAEGLPAHSFIIFPHKWSLPLALSGPCRLPEKSEPRGLL